MELAPGGHGARWVSPVAPPPPRGDLRQALSLRESHLLLLRLQSKAGVVPPASLDSETLTLPIDASIVVREANVADVVEGNIPPQNMRLWHKNCLEPKVLEFLKFLSA